MRRWPHDNVVLETDRPLLGVEGLDARQVVVTDHLALQTTVKGHLTVL